MKKGFGWFFIVLGVLNIVRGIGMLFYGVEWVAHGGRLTVFTIGIIILGIWMVNSSKLKTKNNNVNN